MSFPFQHVDWTVVEKVEHPGEQGTSYWQTLQLSGLRIRLVEYSPGYVADHWCQKGHIVHCLEGSFDTEMESTGHVTTLKTGESYVVSDNLSSHRSTTTRGAKLLIIDGNFLA